MRRGRTETTLSKGGAWDWTSTGCADGLTPSNSSNVPAGAYTACATANQDDVGCPTSTCEPLLQQSVCR